MKLITVINNIAMLVIILVDIQIKSKVIIYNNVGNALK